LSETAVVYGLHAVRVLLERHPERVRQLWLQQGREDARAAGLRALALERRVRVGARPAAELERMAGEGVHQGVVAEVEPSPPQTEDDLEELVLAAGRDVLLLVLDGVQDPHNLGACLRCADAAGVGAVIAPKDRAAGLTPVVRKVAAGAAETVPFVQVTNLARTLKRLKELGVWIVGTEGEAGKDLYEADLKGPLAIVMGAEGAGMRRLTREGCDFSVRLPMRGVVESLNVSVATGIVLYEALRQRR
jgi:23S rRNA (guanosine2251-2'-O)-methyltransferase